MLGAAMRFVYVMDPVDRVIWDKDTTFAFQRAAQRRGHVGLHCEPRDGYVEGGSLRKAPPFDAQYLYLTLMLENVRGRTVVMNDPRGLRDANEKLYALH